MTSFLKEPLFLNTGSCKISSSDFHWFLGSTISDGILSSQCLSMNQGVNFVANCQSSLLNYGE